jgi:hypothetical protein
VGGVGTSVSSEGDSFAKQGSVFCRWWTKYGCWPWRAELSGGKHYARSFVPERVGRSGGRYILVKLASDEIVAAVGIC